MRKSLTVPSVVTLKVDEEYYTDSTGIPIDSRVSKCCESGVVDWAM